MPDPSVSPADTIRRLTEWLNSAPNSFPSYRMHEPTYLNPADLRRDVRELLAVGERGKAEIAALTEERDAAVCEAGIWQRDRNVRVAALASERERDGRRIARLTDLFKPEPFHGVRFKLVCSACLGQGEVNGRNSDDPRWVQCPTCKGDGLSPRARAVLAGEEDANG